MVTYPPQVIQSGAMIERKERTTAISWRIPLSWSAILDTMPTSARNTCAMNQQGTER